MSGPQAYRSAFLQDSSTAPLSNLSTSNSTGLRNLHAPMASTSVVSLSDGATFSFSHPLYLIALGWKSSSGARTNICHTVSRSSAMLSHASVMFAPLEYILLSSFDRFTSPSSNLSTSNVSGSLKRNLPAPFIVIVSLVMGGVLGIPYLGCHREPSGFDRPLFSGLLLCKSG